MLMVLAANGRVPSALRVVLVLLAAPAAGTEVSPELLDVAARIEYGFHTEDQRAIKAARASIGQLRSSAALAAYYDALGAYRLALLAWHSGDKGAAVWLDDCAAGASAAAKLQPRFAEAPVLQAACAVLAARVEPVTGVLQRRKADKALARGADGDPNNPRLALVAALAVSPRPGLEVEAAGEVRAHLTRALERFREYAGDPGQPDWGEAETLAHLGESYLVAGDQRRARDLIEEALIIAPDYRFAQRLMNKVSSRH